MPNFDGTGPTRQGSLTGRRRGRCRDNQTKQISNTENQSKENNNFVYGIGRGGSLRGAGGFGNRFNAGFCNGQGRGRGRGFGNK